MAVGDFNEAMAQVWSRCLRLSAGAHGVRRLLVPFLDLANHEPLPSALYAFAPGAACGPAIRLHAARPLAAGDPVTITYGEHTSAHFALYYGFVPRTNPFDALQMTAGVPSQALNPRLRKTIAAGCVWPSQRVRAVATSPVVT